MGKIEIVLRKIWRGMGDSKFWNGVLMAFCVIGGAVLIDKMYKKVYHYKCPNCGFHELTFGMGRCPNCQKKLSWEQPKKK